MSVNAIESFSFLKIKKSGFLKIEMQHTCVRGYLRFACNIRFGTERRCAEQCAKVNPRAERWPIARKHLNAGTIFLNFIGQFCINMYVEETFGMLSAAWQLKPVQGMLHVALHANRHPPER